MAERTLKHTEVNNHCEKVSDKKSHARTNYYRPVNRKEYFKSYRTPSRLTSWQSHVTNLGRKTGILEYILALLMLAKFISSKTKRIISMKMYHTLMPFM